jgi:hypothetical protein
LISGPDKRVEVITPVYVGSSHDFGIFKEEGLKDILPSGVPIYTDTGFLGIKNLCPGFKIIMPKKKKKGKKLNGGEKLGNRIISRERVKVEHAIGGLKKFKMASSCFRGITQKMDEVFQVASGLWNLQLYMKSLNVV